jgi:hypothetical protein
MNTGVEEMVVCVFRALMELKLVLTGPPIPMTKRVERGTISETASNNFIVAFLNTQHAKKTLVLCFLPLLCMSSQVSPVCAFVPRF